ncbi:MAG: response regulator, partial [Alicyclobacillus sp.]|nr:response regulator [Alicyclobacillus sp.]
DTKVIMMTAYGELDLIQEAMEMGALAHFTKPFDIEELRQAVNAHLA